MNPLSEINGYAHDSPEQKARGAEGQRELPPPQGPQARSDTDATDRDQPEHRQHDAKAVQAQSGSQRPLREILVAGLAVCKRGMWTVGLFSVAVNLLMLTLPIYLFQITDRVLSSGSIDTLIMLSILAVGALGVLALLNVARRVLLTRIGMRFEALLGSPLLSSGLKSLGGDALQGIQRLQDLSQIRNFVTGPLMLNIFDAAMAPIYFIAVFLIHPHLGAIVLGGGLLLSMAAIANQKLTVDILNQANGYSMKAFMQAQAHARNAQVIRAMGMMDDSVRLWGADTANSLKAQASASDRNVYLSGISQFMRLVMQIGLLGWGAYLVLDSQLTGGMMIAASIIGARALAPVEAAIDGWRNFVSMRAASKRVSEKIAENLDELPRTYLPGLTGHVQVEKLSYAPSHDKPAILTDISFELNPGTSLAIVGPSGAGKSTLARLLVGCLEPTAGMIRLDGMPLHNWNNQQLG
ncbi:MAG: ATP-binding cassette domain-containing protein, partial [Rhizobiales bacterium]|nr:ATP-binding cassette domain-containing protein [Hyphomicrobiales bacterium]